MADYIIKDIEELIKSNRGDSQRLSRIKEDFEKTKIISLPDRNYVESLASRYIKEEPKPKKKNDFMKSFRELSLKKPRMPEPSKESLFQKQELENPKPETKSVEITKSDITELEPQKKEYHQSSIFEKKGEWKLNIKIQKEKVALIGAAIIIAIIVIAAVSPQINFEGTKPTTNTPQQATNMPKPTTTTASLTGLSITTDQHSYNKGDIISISGTSETSAGNEIRLSIQNTDGVIAWSEIVKIKSNGAFSTLLIAAGVGWENDGEYTLKAEHGSLTNQLTIDFET